MDVRVGAAAASSTCVKAQRTAFDPEGGVRRSRGGWTTRMHVLTDVIGRPCAPMATPGKVTDMKAALAFHVRAGPTRYLLADEG